MGAIAWEDSHLLWDMGLFAFHLAIEFRRTFVSFADGREI